MSFLDNLFKLEGKIVVVTGVNGQLGTCLYEHFEKAGSKVIGIDLGETDHSNLEYYSLDISNKKKVGETLSSIFEMHGRIDCLINNAGVSTFEPFEERPEESFDWVMSVNLKGTFLCIQEYVNLYDAYNCQLGSILNIGSIFGVVSPDYRNYTDCLRKNSEVYGATKAGIIQMTKYFSVHLAERNIRVNCISPGGLFNPENPQGDDFIKNYSFRCPMNRMGLVEEMCGAALYFASSASSYTTGQNLVIDGGLTSW